MSAPQPISVLIVDDEPQNLLALDAALAPVDCSLVTARSGLEALKRLLAQDFGAIVLDIHMPGMDGFETARLLRARRRSRSTPIIFLTADPGTTDQVLAGYRLGAVDFMYKPFHPDILRSKVAFFVELFRKTVALEQRTEELTRVTANLRRREREVGALNASLEQRIREVARISRQNELILQAAGDGICGADRDDMIVVANPAAARLTGYSVEELIGRPLPSLLGRSTPDGARTWREDPASTDGAHRDGIRQDANAAFRRRDGTEFPSEYVWSPIHEQGQVVGAVLTFKDVTDRRELDRLKDELLGVVSHELRTPVASLVGFTELLLTRDYAEPQRREFLTVMLREGRRLTALINDFLDLQRLESGAQQIVLAPTPLRPLVERAVAAAGENLAAPISVELPDDLPLVLADTDRMEQVLGNLLSNARKYSPAGGDIRVAAQPAEGYVEVAVSDHGLGIPPDALPHMFERFYRVDNSDRRTITGTGLGLAIVRNMVEAHGGRIRAESAGLGEGSTFTFTLNMAQSAVTSMAAAPLSVDRKSVPASGDVLVVEDDPAFARWLSETLAGAGYGVRVAASGEEALLAVVQARPAALLLDVSLAGHLDGWDALAVLRSRPTTTNLPVIMVSARDDHDRSEALGISQYLVKPVQADALLRALHQLDRAGMSAVLVVEDDAVTRQAVVAALAGAGFPATGVASSQEALAALEAKTAAFELLVLDLDLPDAGSFAILDAIRSQPLTRALPALVITARELTEDEQRLVQLRAAELVRTSDDIGVPIVQAVSRLRGLPWPKQVG